MPYEKVGPNDPVCIADEVPFDIPDTWEWIRLGSICEIARGGSPRPINQFLTDSADGINWIKIGDSDKGGKFINSTKEKIIPEAVSRSRLVHAGDFLLTNSMSFGRPYILNIDGCIHDGWLVLSGFQHCYNKDFLFYLLSSTFAYSQFCGVVSGAVVKNLNRDKVAGALFPLPPLAEQQRLVAKIEELLPYIENYDRAEQKLDKLNTEFPEQLKKSILQWAIQGKLLPQNPNDEPASVLLERIRAEKAKLIKEGKIKKDKEESVIFRRDNSHYTVQDGKEVCLDDKLPFEIPVSWSWVKLKELLEQASTGPFGSMLHKSDYVDSGVPLVNPANIVGTQISDVGIKKVSVKTADKLRSYKLFPGDVIIGRRGELGRSAVVPDNAAGWLCGTGCFFVTANATLLPAYLVFLLASPYIREALLEKAVGTTMNNLNHGILGDLLVPLPPKQEQHRILMQWDVLIKRFFA